ncbi:MAG: NifB/NifX family molybdenum-iron cluster-binding protein [Myxococcota bacterium]
MKVAIVSDDRRTISPHFGRTLGFVVFTIENKKIISEEYRPNTFTGHSQGFEGSHNMGHTHSTIINALKDCDCVISNGMGRRLYDDLRSANIKSIITTETDVRRAIQLFLEGRLEDHPERSCSHHNH